MATMNAAVVTSFYEPPHLHRIELPVPGAGQELVEVVAVAVHPEVRAVAAGGCAQELGDPPLVPGVDAVGRRRDGRLIWVLAANDILGTMAERAVAMPHRCVELPPEVDVPAVAAAMLPALREGASFADLPALVGRIASGDLEVRTRTVALRELSDVWVRPEVPGACLVVAP